MQKKAGNFLRSEVGIWKTFCLVALPLLSFNLLRVDNQRQHSFLVRGFVPTPITLTNVRANQRTACRGFCELKGDQRTRTKLYEGKGATKSLKSTGSSSQLPDNLFPLVRKGKDVMIRILTSQNSPSKLQKPPWLSPSSKLAKVLPSWIFHLRPSVQLLATLILYLLHTAILTQHSMVLPFQLIPNDRGNFQSIGLDSLAGMGTLAFYQYLRRQPSNFFDMEVIESSQTTESGKVLESPNGISTSALETITTAGNTTTTTTALATTTTTTTTTKSIQASYLPDLFSSPNPRNMPWKSVWTSNYSRISSLVALIALTRTYFFTGQVSLFWEDWLYGMARHWSWMTVPMHRSLSVLLGHLSWVSMGGLILRWIPRPQPFFQEPNSKWFFSNFRKPPTKPATDAVKDVFSTTSTSDDGTTTITTTTTTTISNSTTITPGQLLRVSSENSSHPQWIWWAVGGYFVSSWLFNIVDVVNSYIFPLAALEQAEESSIVAKLVNPEGQDFVASLVGFLAPCITAPWWEEVLYRGFLLPTLVLVFQRSYAWATFASGILFSIHHQQELAFLPLCVLGWTWAVIYTKSKNLWTTILIHCMWNSRIFLGSWFGL